MQRSPLSNLNASLPTNNFLPDATLVIDRQGKVIAWNKAIEEMTGIPVAETVGKGDYEYAIPFYGVRRPILITGSLSQRTPLPGNITK